MAASDSVDRAPLHGTVHWSWNCGADDADSGQTGDEDCRGVAFLATRLVR